MIGVENTARQQEVNMSVMLVPDLGRNLLSSSATLADGTETTTSAFPALIAKREASLRCDHNHCFLDAILPELPSEYVTVGETSTAILWHRRVGRINAQSIKKRTQEIDRYRNGCEGHRFSVSNCDTCALAKSKQQNHPKVALIEVKQPLQLVYTNVSGPISPASGADSRYVAKSTGYHTRLNSIKFLSKKSEAINALISYTQDVVIPSGHRLQRLRSDRGGEYTGLEYREYCPQTGIKQEYAARIACNVFGMTTLCV